MDLKFILPADLLVNIGLLVQAGQGMTVIGAMLLKADIAALVLCAAPGIIVTLIIMSGRVL